jgi:hypothetical protein
MEKCPLLGLLLFMVKGILFHIRKKKKILIKFCNDYKIRRGKFSTIINKLRRRRGEVSPLAPALWASATPLNGGSTPVTPPVPH